jgi:glycosyltransferase involved in cell wall biosynthesis
MADRSRMKIAFLHYHLKTGGVTTCLKNQVEALKNDCDMCVITGERPKTGFPVKTIHIPELAYSAVYPHTFDPDGIAAALIQAIESHFSGPCDVVHVHNPLLAKNKSYLKILKALQKRGASLFLQIHDFAEDGRPRSYFAEDYPADCHYGVVNSRDYRILLESGLKKQGLHRIFNTVSLPDLPPASSAGDPCVVYPIRAIRRKNIGEAILLSLFFSDDETLVITLPPNSAADIDSYEDWKTFVARHRLRVEFDRGLQHPYESIIASARYLLTTSITEGFGFSFLEPWLFGKWVWGRKLADICADFEANGVCLDHMYSTLNVPVDWFELEDFYQKWKRSIEAAARRFDVVIDSKRIQNTFASLTADGFIDFGLLNEKSQNQVVARLLTHKAHAAQLLSLNPFLAAIGRTDDQRDLIETNRSAVTRNYSMAKYRQKLLGIYRQVGRAPVRQKIDKKILLANFLDLTQHSLLKWGDYGA